jgi:hypothetical protein
LTKYQASLRRECRHYTSLLDQKGGEGRGRKQARGVVAASVKVIKRKI